MFDLNTKIVLVASSWHKNIGPRKSSVGYIAVFNDSLITLNSLNTITMRASVKFLHYGNEKKDRSETRQVLLTFPILQNNQVNTQLNNFIHSIDSDKHTKKCSRIRSALSLPENIPIVVAAPIRTPEVNLKLCSRQEFHCWFESFLMSRQINSFVNKALTSYHFFQTKDKINSISTHKLLILQEMMVDRFARHDLMNKVYKDRNIWINILRIIIITSEINDQTRFMDFLKYTLGYDSFVKTDSVKMYSMLIPYVFYQTFFKFKNICASYKTGSTINEEINKVINTIESTKAAILKLSAKM